QINVLQFLYVQTRSACLVFAKLLHQFRIPFDSRHYVKRQVLFAWRESHLEPLERAAAYVLVLMTAESDYARTPHRRLGFCCSLHDSHQLETVLATLFVGNAVQEFLNARVSLFRLELGHSFHSLSLRGGFDVLKHSLCFRLVDELAVHY